VVEAPPRGELDGLLSGYLRRKRKEQVMPLFRQASRILDLGCGVFVWEGIVAEFQYYLGLDIEPEIVEYNRKHFPDHDFDLIGMGQPDFEELPGDFDLVVMLASIEHIRNPERTLAALKEKLGPGGKVVLTTPAPWGEIILEAGAMVNIFASDKHQHEDLLGKKDLGKLAVKAGFQMTHYARFLFFQNQLAVFERLLA
jgi:2-polyprenyl-3-methyl-5-hydroxy-6-metoxy-1,4-benzoquinol methylase